MVDEEELEKEKQDLVSKIDVLRGQIKTFEGELGISTADLRNLPQSQRIRALRSVGTEESQNLRQSKEILQEIETALSREKAKVDASRPPWIKREERAAQREREGIYEKPKIPANLIAPVIEVKTKTLGPEGAVEEGPAEEQLLEAPQSQEKGNAPPEEHIENPNAQQIIAKRTKELAEKTKEVQEMGALVSKLRKQVTEAKTMPTDEEVQPEPQTRPALNFTKDDVDTLRMLVGRLNELVKTNVTIANELREVISDTRNARRSDRVSELVRKLASVSMNE